jgi:hypothetical protein
MGETQHISALSSRPELAKNIGMIVADYSLLEYQMFILYAALSPRNPAESFSRFYQRTSVDNKTGLLLKEAKKNLDRERFKAVDKLCDRFKRAAKRRTEVAHCVFISDDNSEILRLRMIRDRPVFEPLNNSLITRTINQYRTLSTDISAFLTTVVKSEAELRHILHALPRAPHHETLVAPAPQGRQMQLEASQIEASLSRQGLFRG